MKKKTKPANPITTPIFRDSPLKTNPAIVREIKEGKIPSDNWEYIVRKRGYNVDAIRFLLTGERPWKS